MNPYDMQAADARRRELAGQPAPLGSVAFSLLLVLLGLIL